MVYGMMVHALDEGSAVLFSQFYGREGNDTARKDRERLVARHVLREVSFRREAGLPGSEGGGPSAFAGTGRDPAAAVPPAASRGEDGSKKSWLSSLGLTREDPGAGPAGPSASRGGEEGVFRLPRGPLLASPVLTVWREVRGCAFVVLCNPQESLVLAQHTISLLSTAIATHFRSIRLSPGPESILSRPDDVVILLDHLLPGGKMQLLAPPLAAELCHQAQAAMSAAPGQTAGQ